MTPAVGKIASASLANGPSHSPGWTRRAWVKATTWSAVLAVGSRRAIAASLPRSAPPSEAGAVQASRAAQAARLEPGPVQALARRAVEAATAAGAAYADARLTRTVWHHYYVGTPGTLSYEVELIGCGVRVLVDGCWGFASAPLWLGTPQAQDVVVQLARDAVAHAKTIATVKLSRPHVELSATPVVTGTWTTPLQIDPFGVSIEEKCDTMSYWCLCARQVKLYVDQPQSYVDLVRQERTTATSDGSLVTQTRYESGGWISVSGEEGSGIYMVPLQGIDMAGQGWERFLDAKFPEQMAAIATQPQGPASVASIGRYTLVCDGATMGAVLGETLGIATQLDRSLGYEANSGGTSFLSDPLAMLGTFQVAAPLVTVRANRSAPTQLATVQWDDEGVVPRETTLLTNGVLTDLQTNREQASWLGAYYTKTGKPVASNGYAGSQDALHLPLQMRPNLAMAPSTSAAKLEDLVAGVTQGLFVEGGRMRQVDFQARNGLLSGRMRQITNGKLGRRLGGDTIAILVNAPQFLKQIKAIGDASTTGSYAASIYDWFAYERRDHGDKGNPPQRTSYTAQGVAALITDQAVINPSRKA